MNLESSNSMAGTDLALGKMVASEAAGVQLWDLGKHEFFNKLVLTKYSEQALHLAVQISDDQVSWMDVYTAAPASLAKGNRALEINVDNLSTRYIRVLAEPALNEAEAGPICQIQVYNLSSAKPNMIEHLGLYGGIAQAVKASQENFHLYLFIGQSNMSSRASIEATDMVAINRAYVFNGRNEWEKAENGLVENLPQITAIQGLNRYATVEVSTKINGYSMASTFAQVITDNNPDIEVGIISNARGGTGLAEWQKGAGTGLYEEAVRRTREAMKSGTLKGILWHQGERNQNEPESYLSSLKQLIADLRNDFQAPQLPCVIGQLLPTKNAIFNQTLTTVSEHIPYSNWASNEGTASIGDGTHLDNASQKLLGQRYAERILEHYSNELAASGNGAASRNHSASL